MVADGENLLELLKNLGDQLEGHLLVLVDRDSENNELLIQSGLTQSNILRKPFLPDKLSQKLNFFTRAQFERKVSVPETLVSKKYNFDLSDLESQIGRAHV